MKLKDIEFAPLCVPLHRRLETLAAFVWIYHLVLGSVTGCIILFYIIVATRFWWLGLLYIIWIYIDRSVSWSNRPRFTFIRRLALWTYFKNYFPISLVKTHDLSADKSYIFATYPHGVMCTGAFSNFATDAGQFSEKFPGLKTSLITLNFNFNMPFNRELFIGYRFQDPSEKSLINLLNNKKGNVAILMVGGVSEAFKSFPGPYRIILKTRKGFVRVALKTGASLVPVFSFGEINVYRPIEVKPNSFWDKILKLIKWKGNKVFLGRGFFQYSIGIIPHRHPIVTVVGKPIDVPKIANPTSEDIDKYHQIFTEELIKLFDEHKTKYSFHPDELELILE